MEKLLKILVTIPSVISIVFGIWHFFVPKIWNWYAYVDKTATEIVIAVRAINVFFSLSLVLFGLINILFLFKSPFDRFSLSVALSASTILWATRFVLQILYPQGSYNHAVQYGMLTSFAVTLACFSISLYIVLFSKSLYG